MEFEEFQTHQFSMGYSDTERKDELIYWKRVKGSDTQIKHSEFFFNTAIFLSESNSMQQSKKH